MFRVGYHAPLGATFLDTVVGAFRGNDATAIQVFTGSPKSYYAKPVDKKDAAATAHYVKKHNIFFISHSPYIINFARDPDTKVLNRYITDLLNIHALGGKGSVLHMGFNVKALKKSHEEACQTMIRNLDIVAKRTPKQSTIILENMAGKGTSMCCRMDEWSKFCDEIPEDLWKRIEWCVDTAHLHGVGEYNLSMRREAMRFYEDFDGLIGWDKLMCFHFNGSSADLGSCVDRHADIGHDSSGKIESKGLRHLARIAWETEKPLIMEIPCVEYPVAWQIATVKSWVDRRHPMHTEFGRAKIMEGIIKWKGSML